MKSYGRKQRRTPERIGTATVRGAKLERGAKIALSKAAPIEPFTKRVDIFVTIFRQRTGDPDNACIKSELDAIVDLGIIRDDSSKFVRSVRYEERPAKENNGKESTEILIVEME